MVSTKIFQRCNCLNGYQALDQFNALVQLKENAQILHSQRSMF